MSTKLRHPVVIRYALPALLLVAVTLAQVIPAWGEGYARVAYPYISGALSFFSAKFPFSLGDFFIFFSILGLLTYPLYGRLKKMKWKRILLQMVVYLLWVYIWFYLAWGLNYSQQNFYQRTGTPYLAYTPENFREFLDDYIGKLNASYVPADELETLSKATVHREVTGQYRQISRELGIHPPQGTPKVKTMLFSSLFSKMAITGYMGPFFCEFNLNGELLPEQYTETYAHEMAHLLGIAGEAEANFYAYQVCIRSTNPEIRYCGYYSVFNHVLNNAYRLMTKEEYKEVLARIRPEIIGQAVKQREYWQAKYSPLIGSVQDWIYDLYLKGNKISDGRKNYSAVVGLLISYQYKNHNYAY